MAVKTWIVFLSFLTMVAFQNCAKAPSESLASPLAVGEEGQNELKVSSNEKGEITFAEDSAETLSEIRFDDFILQMNSGDVFLKSDSTYIYTLTAEEKQNLLDLFKDAKLVSYQRLHQVFTDRMCTMDYNEAYAELVSQDRTFSLGAGSGGCPVLDLYDMQYSRKALKRYLARLALQIHQSLSQ